MWFSSLVSSNFFIFSLYKIGSNFSCHFRALRFLFRTNVLQPDHTWKNERLPWKSLLLPYCHAASTMCTLLTLQPFRHEDSTTCYLWLFTFAWLLWICTQPLRGIRGSLPLPCRHAASTTLEHCMGLGWPENMGTSEWQVQILLPNTGQASTWQLSSALASTWASLCIPTCTAATKEIMILNSTIYIQAVLM